MNRPMVWVAAAVTVGILAAAEGWCPGIAAPLVLCALALGIAWTAADLRFGTVLSVALAGFAVGALMWNARHGGPPGDPLSRYAVEHPEIKECEIEGRVRATGLEQTSEDSHQFLVDADRAFVDGEWRPLTGGVTVRWNNPGFDVYAMDRVSVRGRLSAAIARVNPGASSYEDYMRGMRVHSALETFSSQDVVRLSPGGVWSLSYWASHLRVTQTRGLRAAVPESALPFVMAIWLGYSSTISNAEYQMYVQAGIAHILSVSGLHMAMIYVSAGFILNLLVQRRKLRTLLIMAALALFTFMTGMRPSALRSAIMLYVYLSADLFDRERDTPTALSLSALLLLLWSPDCLFDVGFQMSFLCVASMLLFTNPIRDAILRIPDRIRQGLVFLPGTYVPKFDIKWPASRGLRDSQVWTWFPRYLPGALATTLAVQILPAPIAIRTFHGFPLASVAANLVAIPLSTVALWLSMLTAVSLPISSGAASLFGHALWPVVTGIQMAAKAATAPLPTYVTLTSPTIPATLCFISTIVGCAIAFHTRQRHWWIVVAIFGVLTAATWRPMWPQPMVVFLDVGHGDATFIRTRTGRTLLVDGGDLNRMIDQGQRTVAPFLWSNGVTRLDYVAVSHADSDHIGGLIYLLDHFKVGEALLASALSDRPLEREFLDACARHAIPIRLLHTGDSMDLGGATLETLHPPPDWRVDNNPNDASLTLRIRWEGTSILLTGDIESWAEAVLARLDCHANILKAPHHGSKTSSSETFLQAVYPEDCIVSTGGEHGHEPADPAALARYEAHGIAVWRTDYLGGIRLIPRRNTIIIEGERPRRNYPYCNK